MWLCDLSRSGSRVVLSLDTFIFFLWRYLLITILWLRLAFCLSVILLSSLTILWLRLVFGLSVIVLSSLVILWLRLAFCLLVTVRSKLSLFWLLLIMVHMVTQIYQIVFFSRFSCMFFRHWVNLFCLWLWDLSRSGPRVILWLGTFIFFLWLYLLVAGGEVELTGISLGSTNLWSWYLACMLYIDLLFRLLVYVTFRLTIWAV